MLKRLPTYFLVWKITALNALQQTFISRSSNILFLLGKGLRFTTGIFFLLLLKNQQVSVAGYSTDQVVLFFLTYHIVDTIAQVFFRGVYMFSQQVKRGEFDFALAKPINPLFRSLTGAPDINDTLFLIPTFAVTIWLGQTLDVTISAWSLVLYVCLLLNSLVIATGIHILILAAGIITTDIDNLIWLYRDLSRLGQFPVTMYLQPLRFALFFLVPIGMMITIPSQVLLHVQPTVSIAVTTIFGVSFFYLSLKIWNFCLRKYSSASS